MRSSQECSNLAYPAELSYVHSARERNTFYDMISWWPGKKKKKKEKKENKPSNKCCIDLMTLSAIYIYVHTTYTQQQATNQSANLLCTPWLNSDDRNHIIIPSLFPRIEMHIRKIKRALFSFGFSRGGGTECIVPISQGFYCLVWWMNWYTIVL